jgi:hypothetical protein
MSVSGSLLGFGAWKLEQEFEIKVGGVGGVVQANYSVVHVAFLVII